MKMAFFDRGIGGKLKIVIEIINKIDIGRIFQKSNYGKL